MALGLISYLLDYSLKKVHKSSLPYLSYKLHRLSEQMTPVKRHYFRFSDKGRMVDAVWRVCHSHILCARHSEFNIH